jgi:hypothetical protein
MAIRGVYTDEEKKMLADWEKFGDGIYGWKKSLKIPVATEASMRIYSNAVDPWNPLWSDKKYAANTQWCGIIAPPFYLDADAQWSVEPPVSPSCGYFTGGWTGEDWEVFKPVHENDCFKVWNRKPTFVDITDPDGKGLRQFGCIIHDCSIYNQRDELVTNFKLYLDFTITPDRRGRQDLRDEYIYTKEELEYIDRLFKEQEIRGAKVRWWEDVKVGEELKPVVYGPTTLWDEMVYTFGRQEMDLLLMVDIKKSIPPDMLTPDPITGVTHHPLESIHFVRKKGMPPAVNYGISTRQTMARCLTNWMGDDGFIKKFHWRHLSGFLIGDTGIGHGRVVGKRIENSEHLVDISLWMDTLRGDTSFPAVATISLLSKEG